MAADQEHQNEQREEVAETTAKASRGGAEPGGVTKDERGAQLETDLAQARAEAAANWEKYLRERAEMENYRKRQDRVAADRIRYEKRDLLQKVLEVMDNLDRAMHFEESMDRENLHQGLRMVHWQLDELLKGEGLSTVPTVGQPFDPRVHEAIEQVGSSEYPEGVVVEDVRKGYMLGDELLRPARVKVSSGAQG